MSSDIQRPKVLFYVDTVSMLAAAVEAAQGVHELAGAQISVLLVDAEKHYSSVMSEFEVYDYSVLFRESPDIAPLAGTKFAITRREQRRTSQLTAILNLLRPSHLWHNLNLARHHSYVFYLSTKVRLTHWRNLARHHGYPILQNAKVRLTHGSKLARQYASPIVQGAKVRVTHGQKLARYYASPFYQGAQVRLTHGKKLARHYSSPIYQGAKVRLTHAQKLARYYASPIYQDAKVRLTHGKKLARHYASPIYQDAKVRLTHGKKLARHYASPFYQGAKVRLTHGKKLARHYASPFYQGAKVRLTHAQKLARYYASPFYQGAKVRLTHARKLGRYYASPAYQAAKVRLTHAHKLARYHASPIYQGAKVRLTHGRKLALHHGAPFYRVARLPLAPLIHGAKLYQTHRHKLPRDYNSLLLQGTKARVMIGRKLARQYGHPTARIANAFLRRWGRRASSHKMLQLAFSHPASRLALMVPATVAAFVIVSGTALGRNALALRDALKSGEPQAAVMHGVALVGTSTARTTLRLARSAKEAIASARTSTRNSLSNTPAGRAAARFRFASYGSRGVRRFLDVVKPDAVVVLEDNLQTLSRFFVEESRRRGVPSIILPFTIPNPQEPAQFYEGDRAYSIDGRMKRAFSALLPKWRYEHSSGPMMRLPLDQAICYEIMGYSTPNPWVLNLGPAAAVALESEAMRSAYLRHGFQPEALEVVGEPISKVLYDGLAHRDEKRAALCAAWGLDPDRRLIVCGMPPDQYNSANCSQFEFASFDKLIEGWMAEFAALGSSANVIVRPHPRLDPKRIQPHLSSNVVISNAPTAELIPLADIYVACISATIRWAIASGVPVVNYDCYRYRYDDYATAPGVLAVECQSDFREQLGRLVNDASYLEEVRRRQHNAMAYWGVVDDQFGPRFAHLVDKVLASRERRLQKIAIENRVGLLGR